MKENLRFWAKVTGIALFILVLNIAISVLEVFVYALIIPGKERSFYDAHALVSAPWVSGICGAILMYLFVRRYIKRNVDKQFLFAIGLPTAYVAIDVAIILAGQLWTDDAFATFLCANAAKYAGAMVAYFTFKQQTK